MGMHAVARADPVQTESVVWVDVVDLLWQGPPGPCEILASFRFQNADARIVSKPGSFEMTVIGGLGHKDGVTAYCNLCEEEVVALQFRAWTPTTPAEAGPVEIMIRSLDDL